MMVLAVETCTRTASVALVDEEGTVAEEVARLGREHCRKVPSMVARILQSANCSIEEVDGFAAGIGPGSFTGLRVGVAIVKGLSFARGKPAVGIHSLEALAARVAPRSLPVWAVLETGRARGDVYWALYQCTRTEPELVEGPGCQLMQELARRIDAPGLVVGDSVCRRESAWRTLVPQGVDLGGWNLAWPRASTIGLLAVRRLLSGRPSRPEDLAPAYVAAPEVGRRRRTC